MDTLEFKNLLKVGKILLIILIAYFVVGMLNTLQYLKYPVTSGNSITVTGEGEAYAVPDIATFSFSVSAEAKDVNAAQSQVTEKMNGIIEALKNAGVDEKDIKTTDYNVYPKYTYSSAPCGPNFCPPGRQTQDGFTASHSLSVKVRKTDDAGKLLSLVGDKGATNLSGINFTVDNQDDINAQAREEAIADAKAKAKELSKQLDVRLGKVLSFDEGGGGYPMPYAERASLGVSDAKNSVAPTVPTGENKITSQVTITYEIH